MELEELKASWSVLNERLEKNEILNRRIIREMITKRTMGARDRLVRANVGGMVFILLVALVLIFMKSRVVMRWEAEFIVWLGLFLAFIYCVVSLRFLSRFDLAKCSLAELKCWTIKLKKQLHIECIIALSYGVIMLITIFFAHHHYRSVPQMLFDLVLILFTIGAGYFTYKYVDKKSAEEIEKGLEELKEFEEESE
jgi:cation transport ATPase